MNRNDIISKLRLDYYSERYCFAVAYILTMINKNKILFPCLELPITTVCTLCCENCSNLMQYYEYPYILSTENVLNNLDKLVNSIDGISCLRILGGEPLLSPILYKVLEYANQCTKIHNILIVTNGTMLFSDKCLFLMCGNPKCKVSISDYGVNSKKIVQLEEQLTSANILYNRRKVVWRDKANIRFRGKNDNELMKSFQECPNRFFSLLKSELHMCPRSAHGTDLNIVPRNELDFIQLEHLGKKEIREKICTMLKRPYINACNFCDEDISETLLIVEAGVQCKKNVALKRKQDIMVENRKAMEGKND